MKRLFPIIILSIMTLPVFAEAVNTDPVTKREIGKITIQGNEHISSGTIKEAIFTKTSHWWNRQYFEMELFKDDLRAIITLYNNRGYLDAEISTWDTIHVNTDEVDITITVKEGVQSRVGDISFQGNRVFTDVRLFKEIQIASGKPFSFLSLSRSTWNIINAYANAGYLNARTEPKLETNENIISVNFLIEEGSPIYVDTVIIQGNEKTKPRVVERELRIEQGQLLTHQQIIKSQKNLYKTGIFNSVAITPALDTTGSQFHDVYIRLREAKTGELNVGFGYGSRERVRTSAELLQANINGTGQRIGVGTKLSRAEFRAEALYTAPYFILWGIRLDNTLYYRREGEPHMIASPPVRTQLGILGVYSAPNYIVNRIGTEATIGKDFFQISRLSSTAKIENNYYSEINIPSLEDTADSRIRSISVTYTRDSRKNLFNTSTGSFAKISGLVAGSIFAGTNSFFRLTGDYTKWYPYRPWLTLAINFSTGTLFEIGEPQGIPIYERFYAGGDQSVRGYRERELSPTTEDGKPIGGKMKAVFRAESRFKVYKGLHLAVFYDSGKAWSEVQFANLETLRSGVGIGLRYETPIGVARLDYGIKINRRGEETPGQFHLTLGQAL